MGDMENRMGGHHKHDLSEIERQRTEAGRVGGYAGDPVAGDSSLTLRSECHMLQWNSCG
jgi:hypothetical protein